jgi:mono/diheme cytochrome c family protein
MNRNVALVLLVGGLLIGTYSFWSNANDQQSAQEAYEAAGPSKMTPQAEEGRLAFNQNCAVCHGRDAKGGSGGPPLIHKIYEPSHHGDGSFRLAVQRGVQQHHWQFGNMPPQPQVAEADVENIIVYVREAQRAVGIF